MAELGYKIFHGNKNEKEKGFTSGNPLPKDAAEAIMKHLQETHPRTDYWLVEVEYTPEPPNSHTWRQFSLTAEELSAVEAAHGCEQRTIQS